jgi:enoyl-CoA hydratase/carnithine racemase
VSEFVRVQTEGAVGTIRLDRPPMNALNAQVQDELAGAAAQVTADGQIRAVVIYGGDKVFAAGADIKEMAEASYATMAAHSRRLQAAFTAIAKIPKPVVAANWPSARTSGSSARGRRSASRRSCWVSSRARAGRSGCPA